MRIQQLWRAILLGSVSFCLIGFGLEHYYDLSPCPLCYIERICLMGIAFMAALGLRSQRPRRSHAMGVMIWSAVGLCASFRQTWIQYFYPNQPYDCMPPLTELLRYVPIQDVLTTLFSNAGACSTPFYWWGLSVGQWTLLGFTLFCLLGWKIYRRIVVV